MPKKSQPGLGPGPPRRPTGRSRPPPPPLGLGQRDLAPVQLGPVQLVERGLEVLVGGELDDSLALVVLVRIGVAHLAGLPHVILQVLVNEEKKRSYRAGAGDFFTTSLSACVSRRDCQFAQPQLPAQELTCLSTSFALDHVFATKGSKLSP